MKMIALIAGGAVMLAATAVAAPSAHEQHQASGQHAATASKGCEPQMQEMMTSMHKMMQQMSEMHEQMAQMHQGMGQGMNMPMEHKAPGQSPQQPDEHQHR